MEGIVNSWIYEACMWLLLLWIGVVALLIFAMIHAAMINCLFSLVNKCSDNHNHHDAEELRVPEEVTDNTSRQPPTYSSLFVNKHEINYEDPPPPYPGTQEKTHSEDD